jgi:hypothetical protein
LTAIKTSNVPVKKQFLRRKTLSLIGREENMNIEEVKSSMEIHTLSHNIDETTGKPVRYVLKMTNKESEV